MKFSEKLDQTAGRVDSVCQELSRNVVGKDFALQSMVSSFSDDQTALEDRFRSENVDKLQLELDSLS